MSIITKRFGRALAVATAVTAVFALSACAGDATSASGTITEGKLTIATGEPAYTPWVTDDKPESGEGFEAAVAYAVAEELGYKKSDVEWVRTTFDSAVAPGPKDFDLNLQQFTITEDRKKAVDFSAPYYTTTQAVITIAGSKAEGATSIDALKDVAIGVAAGTTSQTVSEAALGTKPQIFNSQEDAVLALTSNQVDAIVVDLPTAFYLTGAELDGGLILGQFEDATGGDEFGIVLPKGSALTERVSAALETLRENGTLQEITDKWLSSDVDVPVLK